MKFEWKKQEKELYSPKNKPEIIKIPKYSFFMLDGKGNPNLEEFSQAVGVIYSLAYCIKMMPKKGKTPDGYYDYTVFPLEGIWDLSDEGKESKVLNKDNFVYTIMIRQPNFVTPELAEEAIITTKKNKPHILLDNARFESFEEGLCVQMMHIGPYDDEPVTFSKMEEFAAENNLVRKGKTHREIYISDVRKTEPAKLNTILRFQVDRK